MEYGRTDIELRTSEKYYDEDDKKQECNAYLRTKLFMAKRIAEQQAEIEYLKEQLLIQTIKVSSMYDSLKQINYTLATLQNEKNKQIVEDKINLSGELVSSVICEDDNTNNIDNESKEQPGNVLHVNQDFHVSNGNHDKYINFIKNQNLELNKDLERMKNENIQNNIYIKKFVNDKFILFTELNELVNILRNVDMDKLNKFYFTNVYLNKIKNINNTTMSSSLSSLGVKYNILSAQNQLGLISITDNLNENFLDHDLSKNGINLDKYLDLIKPFEDELNSLASEFKYSTISPIKSFSTRASDC
jgi:hypothetical protein